MISTLATKQRIESPLLIQKKESKSSDLFSFLTDYKSGSLDGKTEHLSPCLQIKSRITTKGKIKFCNTDFTTAIKASSKELQNQKITNTFHPEMPKVVLEYIKSSLLNNEENVAVIKHIDNNGKTIWLNTHFLPNKTNKLNIGYSTVATASSKSVIEKIEKIYNTVFLLENHVSYDIAKKYFQGLLEIEYGNYDGFIINTFQ